VVDSGGKAARAASQALARAAVYRVLAAGLEEPTEQLVRMLRSGELVAEVEDGLAVLWGEEADVAAGAAGLREATHSARHQEPADVLRNMRVEYARLFTGPGLAAVAAHESQYDGGRGEPAAGLFGAITSAVAAVYAGEGLSAASGEPADRAAAELEFLYYLSKGEVEAQAAGDEEEAGRCADARRDFVRTHAAVWLPALSADLGEQARLEVYRGLAALLRAFLRTEDSAVSTPAGTE